MAAIALVGTLFATAPAGAHDGYQVSANACGTSASSTTEPTVEQDSSLEIPASGGSVQTCHARASGPNGSLQASLQRVQEGGSFVYPAATASVSEVVRLLRATGVTYTVTASVLGDSLGALVAGAGATSAEVSLAFSGCNWSRSYASSGAEDEVDGCASSPGISGADGSYARQVDGGSLPPIGEYVEISASVRAEVESPLAVGSSGEASAQAALWVTVSKTGTGGGWSFSNPSSFTVPEPGGAISAAAAIAALAGLGRRRSGQRGRSRPSATRRSAIDSAVVATSSQPAASTQPAAGQASPSASR